METPKRRRWTVEEDENLAFYWTTTEPVWSIAKRFNRTVGSVYERAKQRKLPRKPGVDHNPLRVSPNCGLSVAEIAAKRARETPEHIENRDDEHWANCLAAGGFPHLDFDQCAWVWPRLEAAE